MNQPLDATLKRIQRQTEEEAAQALATRLGLSYEMLDAYPFELRSLSTIPLEVVQEKQYACFLKTPSRMRVAIVHPEQESVVQEVALIAEALGGLTVDFTVVSKSSIASLLVAYIQLQQEYEEAERLKQISEQEKEQRNYFNRIKSIDDFKAIIETASVTEMIDVILAAGFNQQASDIHLEPSDSELTVRFRIDGVLQRVIGIPMETHKGIISRIKMMSNLKLDLNSTIQDGRFSLADKGIDADIRLSLIPTAYGEGVVMRILRQDMQRLTLQALGFSPYNLQLIDQLIRKPYGLILVTGPTGSGKSTSLYAMLDILNTPDRKIITLEDPVEYRVAGLQQSQVQPDKGFTFAEGLKGAMRQDPDVIMVGEIRDPETATIALNASLTGHLVLSTLHTNSAVAAAARFIEMGIPPFLLNGSIQMIIAQRLVRKVVPGSDPANPKYEGRIVISEVLHPNQEFEQGVLNKLDQATLQDIAVRGGMIPMLHDGLLKVQAGLTTQSELARVTEI